MKDAVFPFDHEIVSLPEMTLYGRVWEGAYSELPEGGLQALIASVKAMTSAPLIGVSWNDRPDGFRYLIGAASDEFGADSIRWTAPAHQLLQVSYQGDPAGVTDTYAKMMDAISAANMRMATEICHHREGYGTHDPFANPLHVKLGIPITPL